MTDTPTLLEAQTGDDPRASIIILHGLGADGSDFAPFVDEIDLRAVGPVRWLFPNAPQQSVTINGGYVMPAWYDIRPDRSDEDEAGLRQSQALVEAVIRREQARGIPAHRIVLGGFSQGCAMALLTGLRYPERLAGVVGMSGYLPLARQLADERSAANADVPIFLAHGTQDEMVALPRATASRDALQALGYAVEWHDYPMGHSVCMEEVQDLRHWLLRVLAAPAD
ncbi:alpha/beta hydrolase [Ottowia sp. SB7-C50]|uniref:alpha/beta hydrolase n=1 Tax=Ottowia sp. SB7-C50 TaxID=3081231 RepID=UPI00295591C7|nr:dienelactone hydrolase family protein [Ottowia sp. SB7-C50]WOP16650.1 dienelactone hydrolase family protein [Ottowia sp. SB7-C50]